MASRGVRPEKKNFYLGIVDPEIEKRIKDQLSHHGTVVLLQDICQGQSEPEFGGWSDIVIMSPAVIRGILHGGWLNLSQFFGQAYIIGITGDDEFQANTDILDLAHGWIAGERQFDNVLEVVDLSLKGYQCFPHASEHTSDNFADAAKTNWSLSATDFVELTDRRGKILVGGETARRGAKLLPAAKLRNLRFKDMLGFSSVDPSDVSPGLAAPNGGGTLAGTMSFDHDGAFAPLLSRILRAEFILLMGIALFMGDRTVSRILQSVTRHDYAELIIIGCAVAGMLLSKSVSPDQTKRPDNPVG